MKTKKSIVGIIVLGSAIGGATCIGALRGGAWASSSAHADSAHPAAPGARAVAAPLRCSLRPEQRIGLTVTSRTTAGASAQPRAPGEGEATLSGDVELRVLSAVDEGAGRSFTLAGVFTHPEVVATGSRVDDVSAALAEPVLFRLDDACRITAFAAPKSMLPSARNQWKMTLKLLEFAVPAPGDGRSWTTTQSDGLGALTASYQRVDRADGGVELRRGRLGYAHLHKDAGGRITARVVSSRARAELAPAGGWLTSASVDEHVIVEMDHQPMADVRTTVRVAARDVAGASGAFWSRDFDPARYVFGPADTLDELAARLPFADRAPIEGLGGRSIDDVITVVTALLAKKPQADLDSASVLLVQYLRLDPRNAGRVLAQLHRADLNEGARSTLLLGLQLAGGRDAHDALRLATRDARLDPVDRLHAVSALSEVPDPDGSTIDTLLALRGARGEEGMNETAQLGLGALARSPALDAAGKDRVRAALVDDLTAGGDSSARGTALAAAGNAGDPALREQVAAYTRDADPLVRAEAYDALTKIHALPPPAALLDALATADAPRMKSVLAEALHGAPLGPAEIARCIALLDAQPSPDTRAILIDLLGKASRDDDSAKAALVRQASLEKDRALLDLLGRYLAPADLL